MKGLPALLLAVIAMAGIFARTSVAAAPATYRLDLFHTGGKGIEKLIDENIEWLKEHKVKIDAATKSEAEFKAGGLDWSRVSFKATQKDTGESRVAFIFADLGGGKLLLITYWITEEGLEKHIPSINALFESFKRL